jgi:hypothetical protein
MTNHITKLLNKAKNITGSDYMTAKRLQVSRQYVSKVRNGNAMSVAFAFDLAELIGEDPAKVLAAHQADQAHTPEERRRWERWVAAALVAILATTGVPGIIEKSVGYVHAAQGQVIHYAKWIYERFLKFVHPLPMQGI